MTEEQVIHYAWDFDRQAICGIQLKGEEDVRLDVPYTPNKNNVTCNECLKKMAECYLIENIDADAEGMLKAAEGKFTNFDRELALKTAHAIRELMDMPQVDICMAAEAIQYQHPDYDDGTHTNMQAMYDKWGKVDEGLVKAMDGIHSAHYFDLLRKKTSKYATISLREEIEKLGIPPTTGKRMAEIYAKMNNLEFVKE